MSMSDDEWTLVQKIKNLTLDLHTVQFPSDGGLRDAVRALAHRTHMGRPHTDGEAMPQSPGAAPDGRVRGTVAYSAAQTGRWRNPNASSGPEPAPLWNRPGAVTGIFVDAAAGASFDMALAAFRELRDARRKHRPMNSAHEGFAVLLEEVEELKAHVWAKQSARDLTAMRKEAIQVAAMAIAFAAEVCGEETGRK